MGQEKTRDDPQAAILRRMSANQRLALAAQLRESNLRLLRAGIRSREGRLSPAQMRLRVLEHVLPARLYSRFFAP